MRHANVSFFIPHAGCPHTCSFCAQTSISGAAQPVQPDEVERVCEEQAQRMGKDAMQAQIAFFGGSFTAIDRAYMVALLEAAFSFVREKRFDSIRISTRPDCIDAEILQVLSRYGVKSIELGAQSMSDTVLKKNGRGHTVRDIELAARLISGSGFELGLQMMTGLYGADDAGDYETGERLAALLPKTMRIYPTIVLRGTQLAKLYEAGQYRPQTLPEAVSLGARLLRLLEEERHIRVIRMGLHAQTSLEKDFIAGPYHPAFRELCEGKLMEEKISAALAEKPAGNYMVQVAPGAVSKIMGHGARSIEKLRKLGYNIKIRQDNRCSGLAIMVEDV